MNTAFKLRVFCEKHNRWEYYTLGDLVCGYTTESNGEGGIFRQETWGRFTGVLDKNGREIFEGDVIKGYDGNLTEIKYDDDNAGFNICYGIQECTIFPNESEIVGNIYGLEELTLKEHASAV